MITSAGLATQAWLATRPRRHWTSYFKWLQKWHWSWVALGLKTTWLALQQVLTRPCFLIIDDTLVFYNSRKAPESRTPGNSGKLVAAKTLLRVARPLFGGRLVTVLLDSWYMRKTLLFPAQKMGCHVIGQVRKGTALYFPPPQHKGKRGRPRKDDQKLTRDVVGRQP